MKMKNLIIAGVTAAMMCTSFAAAEEAAPAEAPAAEAAAQAEAAAPADTTAPADAAVQAGETVPFETLKILGTQEEGAWSVILKNMTGKEIKSVMIKKMDETEFTKELLAEGETFAKEEQRILYYKDSAPAETEGETADAAAETAETAEPAEGETAENTEEEKLLTNGYDIQLTFAADASQEAAAPAEGTAEEAASETTEESAEEAVPQAADVKVVLHAFPYEDIAEAEILFEEEVAYLKYKSQMTQEEISTLEFEKNVKLREAAAADQSGDAENAEGTQETATPVYEDNSADYTYSDSSSGSYDDSYDYSYDYSYDDSYDYSYDYSYDDSYDYSYDYSYDESYDDYSYDSSYDDYSYDYSDDYSDGDDDACIEDGLFY